MIVIRSACHKTLKVAAWSDDESFKLQFRLHLFVSSAGGWNKKFGLLYCKSLYYLCWLIAASLFISVTFFGTVYRVRIGRSYITTFILLQFYFVCWVAKADLKLFSSVLAPRPNCQTFYVHVLSCIVDETYSNTFETYAWLYEETPHINCRTLWLLI